MSLDLVRERLERMKEDPDGVADLTRLGLRRIPPDLLDYAPWVAELHLDGNEIGAIDETDAAVIRGLTRLRHLSLADNRFTAFPAALESESVRDLDLSGNGIRHLRIGAARLPTLRILSLRLGGLERIDPDIATLTCLEVLDLTGNVLLDLPEEIGSLGGLRDLLISGNPGLIPPVSITRIRGLRLLDLSDNGLTGLPAELGRLPRDVTLHLEANFWGDELAALAARRDSLPILRYLRSLGDVVPNDEAKLLLVGEGNVGKTSLVEALRERPFVEGRDSTHGIEINTVHVFNGAAAPDKPATIKLRSWDFGGQEVYRITHQFFFSPRSVYLVVWRPREGQDENAVEPWIRRIRLRVGDNARVLVVATHGEERGAELDHETLRRRYGAILAGVCVVDSRTGYGIDEIRELLGRVSGPLPQIGEPINVRWMAAREELLSLDASHVKRSTFDRICAKHDVDDEDADVLATLLADLGYIVYFPDDDGLKDVLILQPEWLTKAISHVLEDRATREAGGVLDHRRLAGIWSGRSPYLPAHLHRYLLRLMEKFDISYRIPDCDKSLVGQLVPHERPAFDWDDDDPRDVPLTLECEFAESPPGLVAWLIVRNHRFATGEQWRKGVLLRHPEYGTEGLYELVSPSMLRLRVRGRGKGFFFDILRDTLTHLCDLRWPGLDYRLFVPCPGDAGGRCAGRFPLRSLERLRERRAQSVQCLECLETRQVHELLSGFRTRQDTVEDAIHAELRAIHADLEQSLVGTRALFKALAAEVSDCPRLFAVHPFNMRRLDPRGAFGEKMVLRLWCEEPGAEHPVGRRYTFQRSHEWFADVAPYLRIAARTIALLAPSVGGATAVLTGGDTDAKRVSDFMKSLADASGGLPQAEARPGASGLTRGEGAALRRFRELLLALDPDRGFAGLQRALSPTGEYLWVCSAHYATYEPGLPVLP